MRTIIQYIRSMFCKHEFDYYETHKIVDLKYGLRVSRTCTKCGWHKSYWKY